MILDGHVLTFDIAGLTEAAAERGRIARHAIGRPLVYERDDWQRRLLRAHSERPADRSAADERDELAALHSITSSARASRDAGTSRPSALAVLRLMISCIFVACWTGRSAGFSPLRILPA